jgi:hypothetical protein
MDFDLTVEDIISCPDLSDISGPYVAPYTGSGVDSCYGDTGESSGIYTCYEDEALVTVQIWWTLYCDEEGLWLDLSYAIDGLPEYDVENDILGIFIAGSEEADENGKYDCSGITGTEDLPINGYADPEGTLTYTLILDED